MRLVCGVCVLVLEEPEAQEKYMRRQMMQLPEPNYSTTMFILEHLIKYATSAHTQHAATAQPNLLA